jgi:hypothetical protein
VRFATKKKGKYAGQHPIFDNVAEFRKYKGDTPLIENWRTAIGGDWVLADDGCVIQVLVRYRGSKNYPDNGMIMTAIGQFAPAGLQEMDTDPAKHGTGMFNAKTQGERWREKRDRPLTARDLLCIKLWLEGMGEEKAYNIGKGKKYRGKLAGALTAFRWFEQMLKDRRVFEVVKSALQEAAARHNITTDAIVQRLNDLSMSAEKESVKLQATVTLGEWLEIAPQKETRGRLPQIGSRGVGAIADAEFEDVAGTVGAGVRESQGRQLTNGYEANHTEGKQ